MVRTLTAADGLLPEDLFHSAHDHASASQALANGSPSHLDSAGYLAHIAVELVLKALLLETAGQFRAVHSLQALYATAREVCAAPALPDHLASVLKMLDSYAELRYPNRNAPTEVGTEDLAHLWELMDSICSCFPERLQQAIDALDPTNKGGRVLMKKKNESSGSEDA